ncbi:Carbohydrate sulfotransferase 8 [Aix galericulata]|nr:Carbohydrate sulfotransferase 8 [Aix galericulata]
MQIPSANPSPTETCHTVQHNSQVGKKLKSNNSTPTVASATSGKATETFAQFLGTFVGFYDCVSSNNRDRRLRKNTADGIATVKLSGSLHPAENVPTKLQSTDRRQSSITLGKDYEQQGEEINSIRLHKRRRRFVIKKSPILISMNSSTLNLPTLKSEDRSNSKWKTLYQIQSERKQIMRETCSKYKSNNRRIITPYHVSRIFVEDKYRVLYCEVPKAGCSNWKRVLMVLNGLAASTKDIQHNTVHYGNYLKRLDGFDRKGIYHRLNTYTKMLFIREPFEKLVSAFRDKFEHPNNYYHPVFGKAIISRYRVNATKEALRTGSGVKFKEFIQYLLDVHRPGKASTEIQSLLLLLILQKEEITTLSKQTNKMNPNSKGSRNSSFSQCNPGPRQIDK